MNALVYLFILIHDPSRPSLDEWFRSLEAPSGLVCCDLADATIVDDWGTENGRYYAIVSGKKYVVPRDAIVSGQNLHGSTLIWINDGFVKCFLPGAET